MTHHHHEAESGNLDRRLWASAAPNLSLARPRRPPRIREIGLRRALGARRSDILFQFLLEATMLSLSGGLVGVLLGFLATFVVAYMADWQAVLDLQTLLLAVACSAVIGLLFGTIPARKASLANPVSSLRAE